MWNTNQWDYKIIIHYNVKWAQINPSRSIVVIVLIDQK